jgi:hypothetical protein
MEARVAFVQALALRFARFITGVFSLFCLDFVVILISYWRVFLTRTE